MTDQSGFKLVSELVSLALKRGLWDHIVQHQHNVMLCVIKIFLVAMLRKVKRNQIFPLTPDIKIVVISTCNQYKNNRCFFSL